ncbi:UNVERIFIED_CONTAM: anaerobic selenocysteine-containing dehydrogenase [Acetivibrio alkalicellulosi]
MFTDRIILQNGKYKDIIWKVLGIIEMENPTVKYGMIIDLDKCIGCYACQVNCQKEHNLSCGEDRLKVHTQDFGTYPALTRLFLPVLCNHCEKPTCTEYCDRNALYYTEQGIIRYDSETCNRCLACLEACSCGAIGYQNEASLLSKCDFCFERLQQGLKPTCVLGCMSKALHFGELNHKESGIIPVLQAYRSFLYVQKTLASFLPKVFFLQRGNNRYPLLTKADLSLYNFQFTDSENFDFKDGKQAFMKNCINTVDLMCPAECSISVFVEGGMARKIYGNPESLNNQGTVCAKGAAGLELVYSPLRIKKPLVRIGERGEEKWQEVSWESALKQIAEKLLVIKAKYGAESVVLDCGDLTDVEPYMMLFHAFGTPHTYTHSAICDTNRRWGSKLLMGDERPLPDIQRPIMLNNYDNKLYFKSGHDTKLLINLGSNPLVATRFNYMSRGIPAAQLTNEMYYVVIDPAFTNSAAKANLWLPIVPGTDSELLASMLFYILTHDEPEKKQTSFIDHDFIENYTEGWENFKQDFLAQARQRDETNGLLYFSPEWGADKTGIASDQIIRLAHLMGITKPAAIEIGMHGGSHHLAGDLTSTLANVICAITGNIDVPGGLVFTGSVKPSLDLISRKINGDGKITRIVAGEVRHGTYQQLHKDLYGDYPFAWKGVLSTIPRNILDDVTLKRGPFNGHTYPIKAFVNRTGNPVYTGGNTEEWIKAFTATKDGEYLLNTIVHIDTHINETGKYADFILPECSYLEKMGLSDQYTINPEIALRERVIAPQHESKAPFWIMQKLAGALVIAGDKDINESSFTCYQTEEDLLNTQLRECPGLRNIGQPLPYPRYPEGALIKGLPKNPNVYFEGKLIRQGEELTVEWLRRNGGRAAWPASYYRYRRNKEVKPSGYLPLTDSRKFEFNYHYVNELNKKMKCGYPASFLWKENNRQFAESLKKEYPFHLITGRTHQTGTMTQVCISLSNLETEANKKMNDTFAISAHTQNKDKGKFEANTIAIPVFLINEEDGNKLGLYTGEMIRLVIANGKYLRGKAFLSSGIKSGVIKTTFGSGGREATGIGFFSGAVSFTPNINRLYDSNAINQITGMPAFGDVMVKIEKEPEEGRMNDG